MLKGLLAKDLAELSYRIKEQNLMAVGVRKDWKRTIAKWCGLLIPCECNESNRNEPDTIWEIFKNATKAHYADIYRIVVRRVKNGKPYGRSFVYPGYVVGNIIIYDMPIFYCEACGKVEIQERKYLSIPAEAIGTNYREQTTGKIPQSWADF